MSFENRVGKLIISLYEIGAMKFGDFKMKVGVNSPVYFDLRVIFSHPDLMIEVSSLMSELVSQASPTEHVCGVPYSALLIATLISTNLSIPMLVRRKEAKSYGTKRLIDGKFEPGQSVIIVEDVVTSGSSILETARDLETEGLKISETVVFLDREQGGSKNLLEKGYKMSSLVTLSKAMEILKAAGKVDEKICDAVKQYITKVQIRPDGSSLFEGKKPSYLTQSFESRAKTAANSVAQKLFETICRKKTNLCLAADVETSEQLFKIVEKLAPFIAVLKTHADAMVDWTTETSSKLYKMAQTHDFFIMEDRKMADIGHTVSRQWQLIKPWAHFVTVHALPGEEMLRAFSGSGAVFLLAQMSSKGNLLVESYTKEVTTLAVSNSDAVSGVVCQSPLETAGSGLIRLIPGVRIDKKEDPLGQQYNSPYNVIIEKGADLAVVGRGILESSDLVKTAQEYRDELWSAYLKRINQLNN